MARSLFIRDHPLDVNVGEEQGMRKQLYANVEGVPVLAAQDSAADLLDPRIGGAARKQRRGGRGLLAQP